MTLTEGPETRYADWEGSRRLTIFCSVAKQKAGIKNPSLSPVAAELHVKNLKNCFVEKKNPLFASCIIIPVNTMTLTNLWHSQFLTWTETECKMWTARDAQKTVDGILVQQEDRHTQVTWGHTQVSWGEDHSAEITEKRNTARKKARQSTHILAAPTVYPRMAEKDNYIYYNVGPLWHFWKGGINYFMRPRTHFWASM